MSMIKMCGTGGRHTSAMGARATMRAEKRILAIGWVLFGVDETDLFWWVLLWSLKVG